MKKNDRVGWGEKEEEEGREQESSLVEYITVDEKMLFYETTYYVSS